MAYNVSFQINTKENGIVSIFARMEHRPLIGEAVKVREFLDEEQRYKFDTFVSPCIELTGAKPTYACTIVGITHVNNKGTDCTSADMIVDVQ